MRDVRGPALAIGLVMVVAGIAVPVKPGGFPVISALGAILLVVVFASRPSTDTPPASSPGERPTLDTLLQRHDGSSVRERLDPGPTPIGFTDTGEPVFPVVGYTAQGQPVTADKISGAPSSTSHLGTNSLAVTAVVLGILLPPLAILFGHAALREIRTTGQRGDGLAIAGLILGYLSMIPIMGILLLILL